MKQLETAELDHVIGGLGLLGAAGARLGAAGMRAGAAGVRGLGRWLAGGPMFPGRSGGDGGCPNGSCGG